MSRRIGIGSLVVLLAALTPPARADLTLYVQDTTVAQGGTGILNIYLSSDNPSADAFDNYQFQLQITGSNLPPDILEFATNSGTIKFPTPVSQTYDYLTGWPNYIFAGDSFDGLNGAPGGSSSSPNNTPNDTFTGLDFSNSTPSMLHTVSSVAPTSGGQNTSVTLLASLLLYDQSGTMTDSYTVSVNTAQTYFNNSSNINDSSMGNVNYTVSSVPGAGFDGTITIGPAIQSIPEPASAVYVLTAVPLYLGYRRLRGRFRNPSRALVKTA